MGMNQFTKPAVTIAKPVAVPKQTSKYATTPMSATLKAADLSPQGSEQT